MLPHFDNRLAYFFSTRFTAYRPNELVASLEVDVEQMGYTPLIIAAEKGHEGCAKLLLDAKAAVNAATIVSGGNLRWLLLFFLYLCTARQSTSVVF